LFARARTPGQTARHRVENPGTKPFADIVTRCSAQLDDFGQEFVLCALQYLMPMLCKISELELARRCLNVFRKRVAYGHSLRLQDHFWVGALAQVLACSDVDVVDCLIDAVPELSNGKHLGYGVT
jgi:hypothetical protein